MTEIRKRDRFSNLPLRRRETLAQSLRRYFFRCVVLGGCDIFLPDFLVTECPVFLLAFFCATALVEGLGRTTSAPVVTGASSCSAALGMAWAFRLQQAKKVATRMGRRRMFRDVMIWFRVICSLYRRVAGRPVKRRSSRVVCQEAFRLACSGGEAGDAYLSALSRTHSAPSPPSLGGAWQKARTSERCDSQLLTS